MPSPAVQPHVASSFTAPTAPAPPQRAGADAPAPRGSAAYARRAASDRAFKLNKRIGAWMAHTPSTVVVPRSAYAKIGILGGMGPDAGNDAARKLVAYAQTGKLATTDQDIPAYHLASNSPAIGDRSKFLAALAQDPPLSPREVAWRMRAPGPGNPYPGMKQSLRELDASGCKVIIVTCNTAHAWFDKLESKLKCGAEMVHIADAVLHALDNHPKRPRGKTPLRVALLATTGTIETGIYQQRLAKLDRSDIEFVTPDPRVQDEDVMGAIYGLPSDQSNGIATGGIKAGNLEIGEQRMKRAVEHMVVEKKVDFVALCCTEIPLVLQADELAVPGIDASDALVRRAVDRAEEMVTAAAPPSRLPFAARRRKAPMT